MFDLGWSEILVIVVVALVVIGPKDLPLAVRSVGRWIGKAKAMARDFQDSLNELAKDAELDKVKKDLEEFSRFDPADELKKAVGAEDDLGLTLPPEAEFDENFTPITPRSKATTPAFAVTAMPAPPASSPSAANSPLAGMTPDQVMGPTPERARPDHSIAPPAAAPAAKPVARAEEGGDAGVTAHSHG